jgi:RNase adapter protein RapZ
VNEFVVITGLSGAGRSQAADILEDLGWFVIDNLPPTLIPKVAELAEAPGSDIAKVVLVVGIGPYHEAVLPALEDLRRQSPRVRILFLEANTDVLVRRYESTRRRHPMATDRSLAAAIDAERALLESVKANADVVVDTSDLNVHQLRDRVVDLFGDDEGTPAMQTTVLSFGYKHGLPLDTDLVIDCRFLPNPHWVEDLRPLTGLDEPVRRYVLDQEVTASFLDELASLLRLLMPAYVR